MSAPGRLTKDIAGLLLTSGLILLTFLLPPPAAFAQLRVPQAPEIIPFERVAKAGKDHPYKQGELLIKYRHPGSGFSPASPHRSIVASTIKSHHWIGVKRVRLSKDTVQQALTLLKNDPEVEFAEPN
jgi:hypothetical protein